MTEPAWPGSSMPAVDPRRPEPQHLFERGDATFRHADADPGPRVGRQAVDVRRRRARRRRSPACAASTVSVIGSTMRRRPTCDMPMPVMATWSSNLLAFLGIGRASRTSSGRRPGTGPSRGRRSARTAGSTRRRRARKRPAPSCRRTRRSASQLTMLVVRRTRSSSSMATIAITYGGGKLGIHVCSLIVNPVTTARPDTSAGAHSVEWQYGHTAHRRVTQLTAVGAALEPELAVLARLPEELLLSVSSRQQAPARFGHDHSSVRRTRRTYPRASARTPLLCGARPRLTATATTGEMRCLHS